jgi:hypothetical protein
MANPPDIQTPRHERYRIRAIAMESTPTGHGNKKRREATKAKAPMKKTTRTKSKTKNPKTKNPKTKTKKTKKATVVAQPAELPLVLDPDDDHGLLQFFRLFGTVVDQKRSYRIVDDSGQTQLISKAPTKALSRLVASLVTHFSIYSPYSHNHSSNNIFSRCRLCDLDGLWHSVRRRDHTMALIGKLHKEHPFLSDGEDVLTFIKSYKFGQGHQHYRSRFILPKENPTGWWRNGHQFDGKHCYGLHESLKPFFDLLGVPLGVDANEESDEE